MATYKVPQDVEAEDKLIGPFTFRQFIFLIVASVGILIGYLLFKIHPVLIVIPLPFVLVFGILGIYHREDQPVETYLLAFLNYLLKPRKRIWDPEGLVENVRITAPKKMAVPKLKNLEQERGQLERLAKIIDTHGWYVKRPEITEPVVEQPIAEAVDDDRLVAITTIKRPERIDVPDIQAADDTMDMENNPDAQRLARVAEEAQRKALEAAKAKMQETPLPSKVNYEPYPKMHQRTLDPKSGKLAETSTSEMTPSASDAILNLSQDLPVSAIANAVQAPTEQQREGINNAANTNTTNWSAESSPATSR